MENRKQMFITIIMTAVLGCSPSLRTQNLEMVAKDWCMTVRASQVVPVYPLTEDLQVGDMFLVQRTVDDQQKEYENKGFLPMDNLIGRLIPKGFKEFYSSSFATDESKLTLPKDWLKGKETSWDRAPGVSFPSYSFWVRSGAGLNIAVPVQSVPVGLSLMGSDAGDGTIIIKEAKTYGIDTKSLLDDVREWEREPKNHEFLLPYASSEEKNYVRVISRIFLARKMDVSIRLSASQAGGVSVGAPKAVDLLTVKSPKDKADVEGASVENYEKSVAELNRSIAAAMEVTKKEGADVILPGGTVKIVAASSRAINMEETFARPIVIGYLGFDMAIGPEGILGPPIPTHAVLDKKNYPPVPTSDKTQIISTARLGAAYQIIVEQEKGGDEQAKMLKGALDQLSSLLPKKYPVPIFSTEPVTRDLKEQISLGSELQSIPPTLRDLTKYRSSLLLSLDALKQADELSGLKKKWLHPTLQANEALYILLRQHQLLLQEANEYAGYF